MCEIGVNEIQLVATLNFEQYLQSYKELERLRGIVIAAAEQSKNYAFPVLQGPKNFQDAVDLIPKELIKSPLIFLENHFLIFIKKPVGKNVVLFVGPEGGLMMKS